MQVGFFSQDNQNESPAFESILKETKCIPLFQDNYSFIN